MKTKGLLILITILFFCSNNFAQMSIGIPGLVSVDPAQAAYQSQMAAMQSEQLSTAINTLKTLKKAQSTYNQINSEINQVKQFAENAEKRLQDIGNIQELKLSNIVNSIDKIKCLRGKSYWNTNIRFKWILDMFVKGLVECDNDNIYFFSYGGIGDRIRNGMPRQLMGPAGSTYSIKQVNMQVAEFNEEMANANDLNMVTVQGNKKMMLELAMRYKLLSDEYGDVGEEMYNVAKCADCIPMTQAERITMMEHGLDYQAKSAEYLDLHHKYLVEATKPTAYDYRAIRNRRDALFMMQMANFRKN